jgi:hypothetical protein
VHRGKHAPCRLHQLIDTQTVQIEQLRAEGFVLHPELSYTPASEGLLVSGYIQCEGNLYLQVMQYIALVERVGVSRLFAIEDYSYHAVLRGVGSIFRYDSPHPDHNQEHHVHEYSVIGKAAVGPPRFLYSEAEIPTLGDALRRLRRWHSDNSPVELDL